MKIRVKVVPSGKLLVFEIDYETTGLGLKKKIHERDNTFEIEEHVIVLVATEVLDNDLLIECHHLTQASQLHLVKRKKEKEKEPTIPTSGNVSHQPPVFSTSTPRDGEILTIETCMTKLKNLLNSMNPQIISEVTRHTGLCNLRHIMQNSVSFDEPKNSELFTMAWGSFVPRLSVSWQSNLAPNLFAAFADTKWGTGRDTNVHALYKFFQNHPSLEALNPDDVANLDQILTNIEKSFKSAFDSNKRNGCE